MICVFSLKEKAKTELFISLARKWQCAMLQEDDEGCSLSHELVSKGQRILSGRMGAWSSEQES